MGEQFIDKEGGHRERPDDGTRKMESSRDCTPDLDGKNHRKYTCNGRPSFHRMSPKIL